VALPIRLGTRNSKASFSSLQGNMLNVQRGKDIVSLYTTSHITLLVWVWGWNEMISPGFDMVALVPCARQLACH